MDSHTANGIEEYILREAFGARVVRAEFHEAWEGGGRFVLAEGFDKDDKKIGQVQPGSPNWRSLAVICQERAGSIPSPDGKFEIVIER